MRPDPSRLEPSIVSASTGQEAAASVALAWDGGAVLGEGGAGVIGCLQLREQPTKCVGKKGTSSARRRHRFEIVAAHVGHGRRKGLCRGRDARGRSASLRDFRPVRTGHTTTSAWQSNPRDRDGRLTKRGDQKGISAQSSSEGWDDGRGVAWITRKWSVFVVLRMAVLRLLCPRRGQS